MVSLSKGEYFFENSFSYFLKCWEMTKIAQMKYNLRKILDRNFYNYNSVRLHKEKPHKINIIVPLGTRLITHNIFLSVICNIYLMFYNATSYRLYMLLLRVYKQNNIRRYKS